MSEKQYRLEENNQTNELILWEDVKILNVFKSSYDNRKHLSIIVDKLNELSDENNILKRRLDYETRMHKRWKDDCLAILEEQDLNDYVKELQKSKKSGWDSEPNIDYVTRVKDGLICGCCKHFHSGVRDRCDKDNNWVLKNGSCQDFER